MIDDATMGIMQEINAGTAFDRTLESDITKAGTALDSIPSSLATLPPAINGVSADILLKVNAMAPVVSEASAALPAFTEHVASQFDNLTQNMHLFSSSQGLENALAGKATGCSSMHDFFGSITQQGPSLIAQFNNITGLAQGHITDFKTLTNNLQASIAQSFQTITSLVQGQIAEEVTAVKRQALQDVLSQAQQAFQTGTADVRAQIADSLGDKLSSARSEALGAVTGPMRDIDFAIAGKANTISDLTGQINANRASIAGLITSEQAKLTGATSQLVTLGHASIVKSLFGSDPCIQTLLGYVGSNSLLSHLGG